MRRQDNTRGEFHLIRWSGASGLFGLALGFLLGPPALRLLEPRVVEDSGLIEGFAEVAVLTILFCVGLRLRIPLEWRAWRIPVRLSMLTLVATATLAAAAAHILFDMGLLESLLLGVVISPTDAVLASELHAAVVEAEQDVPNALCAEGALTSGLAIPLVMLVLTLMGVSDAGAVVFGSLTLTTIWSIVGGAVAGWLLGSVMARWITLLDSDARGDYLEEMIVFATAALAYCCALAMRTDGLIAVFTAALALSHGGRLRRPLMRKYALGHRVLRLAGRVERFATTMVMVLVGALVAGVDLRLRLVLFALMLSLLIRPLAVRLGLGGLSMPLAQRRSLEWFGARGSVALYCLALAVNHGLRGSFARELAGATLVVIVASIVFSAVSALSLRRATPGAVV